MSQRELFTVEEAAAYLGVSRAKISKMIKSGELPSEPNPLDRREKLIPRDAVERLARYSDKEGENA